MVYPGGCSMGAGEEHACCSRWVDCPTDTLRLAGLLCGPSLSFPYWPLPSRYSHYRKRGTEVAKCTLDCLFLPSFLSVLFHTFWASVVRTVVSS